MREPATARREKKADERRPQGVGPAVGGDTATGGQGHLALPPVLERAGATRRDENTHYAPPRQRAARGLQPCPEPGPVGGVRRCPPAHPARATPAGRRANGAGLALALVACSMLRWQPFMGVLAQEFTPQPLLSAPDAIFGGQDVVYPLAIKLDRDDYTAPSAPSLSDCSPSTTAQAGVCAEVELVTLQPGRTGFVVSTTFSQITNQIQDVLSSTPPVKRCLDEDIAIALFKQHTLLECSLNCRRREKVLFNVMQAFAGVDGMDEVLTRNMFPIDKCLLGSNWKGQSTYDEMKSFLKDLGYITSQLDSVQCADPAAMSALGCDKIQVGIKLSYKGGEMQAGVTFPATFSEEFPNLAPRIVGDLGFDEMEVGAEYSVQSIQLEEPDADKVVLSLETSGVVKFTELTSAARAGAALLTFESPEYEPEFMDGGLGAFHKKIKVRCTLDQARRALGSMVLRTDKLGYNSLTISVDDEGRSGYPAVAPSLSHTVTFDLATKPSLVPPGVRVLNSDESWRFDWRPGVHYLKGGVELQMEDKFFPCGGDTVFGLYDFPRNGSGGDPLERPPGWKGELPPGDGSEAELNRDCKKYPATFWSEDGRAMYASLDEGGKTRVFVQLTTSPSGCNETVTYKVTLALTNANNSRVNIPIAKRDGYHMDWFECRDGAWYCENRHGMITLNNENGVLDRLNFHYDQRHRHLADGIQDYRMTFSGTHADIELALSNVTLEFPWLDQNAKRSEEPWPFKTWPRTGRSLLGSNILRMRIEDMPAEYSYTAQANQMWTVTGAYRYAKLELVQAEFECNLDPTCYGFQYLTVGQLMGIVEQQQLPSLQLGNTAGQEWLQPDAPFLAAGGFSDRPPTIWGLGDNAENPNGISWDKLLVDRSINWGTITTENLPNTFFFRESFDIFDIQPYQYNAMTYTKHPKTSRCLGKFPHTEQLLDVRVLELPLNQPPIITADKPYWRIQKAYEFPVPGINMYDSDATWLRLRGEIGLMEVSFKATRGAFSFPDKTGLDFAVCPRERGQEACDGNQDELLTVFRCIYADCQRAIRQVRYRSAETPGIDVISLMVDDRGNSGELGALSASISITLSLAAGPYNMPPIVQIPGLPTRVAHPGERVDISGIFVEDVDMNKPRWDKPYAEGYMTVHMKLGRGFFDVTRLRKRGLINSLFMGTADGSTDLDCPCKNDTYVGVDAAGQTDGNACPCTGVRLTTYTKFSGLKEDVKWAAAEVSVYLALDRPDLRSAVDTTLVITVDDNCNTGFSDDSGVQLPCLTHTDSVVIRIIPRPDAQPFLWVSPQIGMDRTVGILQDVRAPDTSNNQSYQTVGTLVELESNASSEENVYVGLSLTIISGLHAGEKGSVVAYNGSGRLAEVVFEPTVFPDTTSVYQINCGVEKLPCRSLSAILMEATEHSRVKVMPGVYSGPANMGLSFVGKTLKMTSTHGFNDTVIDCEGAHGPVAIFSPSGNTQVTIDGFAIRNCMAKDGGAFVFRYLKMNRVGQVDGSGADSSACSGIQEEGGVKVDTVGADRCRKTPVFRNCYFYNNLASGFGGAVYVKDGNPVFDNCIFFSNAANAGGAVYVRGGFPDFRSCSFYSNAAQLGGGGLYINGGRVSVKQTRFQANAATRAGGAISISAGSIEAFDTKIVSNYAGEADGGVFQNGGASSFQSCTQDANNIGPFASELLDQIQTRRQETQYGPNGFADPYVYTNPLAMSFEGAP